MTRFERLSALLERLRNTLGMSVLDLADALGSDRRTIQRDLRYLVSCGHPVGRTRNKIRLYFLREEEDHGESRSFSWCLGADFMPELGRALLEQRRMRILYRGDHSLRADWLEVEPRQLFFDRFWQLRGVLAAERKFAVFHLDRIREWQVLPDQFAASACETRSAWHGWDRRGGPAVAVECQVSQSLALRLRDQPIHPTQQLSGNCLELRVCDTDALLDWMLAQNYCRVLEPDWLRLRFQERVSLLQT
ncbi:MAG: WYL domain-containing protein [Candidatus Eremiobacteraeota bacterium]|nr:WYL domain-containing protein [Candidatus Eremiobacteraeota bacterium]